MRVVRALGVLLLALGGATLLVLKTMTSALASTALIVGGLGESTLPDIVMSQALNGLFTGTDPATGTQWQRESVNWPAQAAPFYGTETMGASVTAGAATLLQLIETTSGPITVVGTSEGALVVDQVMAELASDPNAPPPSRLNFVVIGDGSQQLLDPAYAGVTPGGLFTTLSGYTYQRPPQTPYNLTVVTYQYDGFADFPDQPWNLLADANAVAGMLVLHNATYFVDLSTVPAQDITVTKNASGGTTTTYLVPAQTLPLVTLDPSLAPMAAQLKQMIDTGYTRNNTTTTTTTTTSAASAVTAAATMQSTAAPVDPPAAAPTKPALAPAGQALVNSISNPTQRLVGSTDGLPKTGVQADPVPANGTQVLAKAPAADPAQPLGKGATDLTNGNKVKPGSSSANDAATPGSSGLDSVRNSVQDFNNTVTGLTGAGQSAAGAAGGKSGTTTKSHS